jgi:hypothetical protein
MNNLLQRLAPAMALSLPLLSLAQQTGDPADGKAATQPLRYQSAFSDYKQWQDVKPGNWRQLNDTVRDAAARGGGHAGHGVAASPAQPAAGASAPAAAPHQGQHMHGGKQ